MNMTTLPTNGIILPINRIKLAIDVVVLPIDDVMRLQLRANIANYKLYDDSYCLYFLINALVSCLRWFFNKLSNHDNYPRGVICASHVWHF